MSNLDLTAIVQFAVANPETWKVVSAGYDEETLSQINAEINKFTSFDSELNDLVVKFLDLYPMQERAYKTTRRRESRVLLTEGSYQIELRVWEKLTEEGSEEADI